MRGSSGSAPSLLLVNQHYYPDVASTGQHLTDLAEHLAAEGYDVEVLAGRGKYLAGRMDVPDREVRNGVSIRRVRTTSFGRGSHFGRLIDYASYYVQVLVTLLLGRHRDGVIFLTTPPLLCFLGAIARLVRGQRYGVWSMDLHPDAEIASGMLKPRGLAARFLLWANGVGYRRADVVVDLGQFMKRRIIAMGVDPARTRTVHVWSEKDEIVPTPRDANPLREQLGLRDKFVVMYSGNAGIVHDFRDILEAMRQLKDDPCVHFLFVGDGPRRAEIERYVAEHGITNFEYRGYFPRKQLRWSLTVADAHLISLRKPFVGISVPGKLYGVMASGRPALFVGPRHCESAEAVLDAGCGTVADPETTDAAAKIVETIQCWQGDPALVRELGRRGRQAFLERYERTPNCRAWATLIAQTWPMGETTRVVEAASIVTGELPAAIYGD